MRLDRFKIGSDKNSPTHQFKNLKNVSIDFDQKHWVTVVIGWNGTGKSNVIEALATIFRDLIRRQRKPTFAFNLDYQIGAGEEKLYVNIDADPDRKRETIIVHVANQNDIKQVDLLAEEGSPSLGLRGTKVSLSAFLEPGAVFLPRYVFAYYSGESDRLYKVFRPYLEEYDKKLRGGDDPGPKRLFYAQPVHSQFVLLAFLMHQSSDVRDFLTNNLGIDPDEGIESVLFVLREPPWNSPEGDPRFWKARGVVASFLDRLFNVSIAPIQLNHSVPVSLWNDTTKQFKYLYIKNVDSLREVMGKQTPSEFFRDLESTHVSQLIEEVRIRVKLRNNDGTVTFRELSEGEQQLLTVLGLLRFTSESESLFLLDEPDTHLNPRWAVEYIQYLRQFAGQGANQDENSHILITTHNPIAIASLTKEQVQILHRNNDDKSIAAENPAVDPRGMGFASIITSDMFGLGSSLDKPTNDDLIELYKLSIKSALTSEERSELARLRESLRPLDFNFANRDRFEQEYLRARFDISGSEDFGSPIVTPENKKKAVEVLVQSLLQGLETPKK